jgi:5-(carboxyamino)imidazole ribonucleotide mutase
MAIKKTGAQGAGMERPKVLVLLGSDSDLTIIEDGLAFLKKTGVPYMVDISSAHRDPEKTVTYARGAREDGIEVIIAVAGMAAHLPGVIASHTTLPVIGVPASGGILKGTDALYSIVQMPAGVPVASVGIDAGRNAAILACEILSIKYDSVAKALTELKKDLKRENEQKSLNIRNKLGN